MSRVRASNINGFVSEIAQGVVRDACARDAGQGRNLTCRRIIHNEPHSLRPRQETRTDLLVANQETDGLQVETVGGTM